MAVRKFSLRFFVCDGNKSLFEKFFDGYPFSAIVPIKRPISREDLYSYPTTPHMTHALKMTVIHRLGLYGETEKTYKEIGKILGVSGERVRQYSYRAYRFLKIPSVMDIYKEMGFKIPEGEV